MVEGVLRPYFGEYAMRHLLKTAALLGSLSVSLGATTALAGGCGMYAQGPSMGSACQTQVVVHPGQVPYSDSMNIYSSQPMGRLKTVEYMRSPSVNIMRVHGMGPTAQLSDAPSGFTNGCMPESTSYCRSGGMRPAPMPQMQMPLPMPVIAQPAPEPRIVAIGGGYDPSKFIPRTYGSNELTPGIAHIPTSIVDRSHANAQAVLNSGMTRPQAYASGGIAPHPSMVGGSTVYQSPHQNMGHQYGNVIGMQTHAMTVQPQNSYAGSVSGDGSYWEQVSNSASTGGNVICKRAAQQVNVQRPVIGVPVPVPTPMPMSCYNNMPQMAGGRY